MNTIQSKRDRYRTSKRFNIPEVRRLNFLELHIFFKNNFIFDDDKGIFKTISTPRVYSSNITRRDQLIHATEVDFTNLN